MSEEIKYIKHIKYTDTEDNIVYRYFSKDELEDALKRPEYRLFLFKEDGAVITKTDIFPNETLIPDIAIVLEELGCEVHTFKEMEELFKDIFENHDMYLPFDMDELHYTYDGEYMGFCYRDSVHFILNGYEYFFGLINIDKEDEEWL